MTAHYRQINHGGHMQTTMHLLEKALAQHPAPYWTKKLNLARTTLATAKVREHLSPAIAGALAEELGEEADKWIVIAALEASGTALASRA